MLTSISVNQLYILKPQRCIKMNENVTQCPDVNTRYHCSPLFNFKYQTESTGSV